jgi:hypothetical protein
MPRPSAAARQFSTVAGVSDRLRPPPELGETERQIFIGIVASSKGEHFKPSDLPLLCAYCRAIALETRSAQELSGGDAKALARWATATKVMSALSMRLRLSPQARQPNNPSRPGRPAPPMSYYERMALEREDDQ